MGGALAITNVDYWLRKPDKLQPGRCSKCGGPRSVLFGGVLRGSSIVPSWGTWCSGCPRGNVVGSPDGSSEGRLAVMVGEIPRSDGGEPRIMVEVAAGYATSAGTLELVLRALRALWTARKVAAGPRGEFGELQLVDGEGRDDG